MVNDRTLAEYRTAGVDYMFKGPEEHIMSEKAKSSQDKNKHRWVNQMFRFRTNEANEYILYRQVITTKANYSGNEISWTEDFDDTSLYRVPIVEKVTKFDHETEKQTIENKQIKRVDTHYLIPFNEEEAAKLKPYTNLGTRYFVRQEDGIERTVSSYEEWLTRPFEELIAGIPASASVASGPTPTPTPTGPKRIGRTASASLA
jgi:hypothetical protein